MTNLDDVLRDRLAVVKAQRDSARGALERAKERSACQIRIDPPLTERFGCRMKENFSTDWVPFRKAGLQPSPPLRSMTAKIQTQRGNDLVKKAILASYNAPSSVRRRILSGAPVGIKMRTPM